jgi:hypothetical protein
MACSVTQTALPALSCSSSLRCPNGAVAPIHDARHTSSRAADLHLHVGELECDALFSMILRPNASRSFA